MVKFFFGVVCDSTTLGVAKLLWKVREEVTAILSYNNVQPKEHLVTISECLVPLLLSLSLRAGRNGRRNWSNLKSEKL